MREVVTCPRCGHVAPWTPQPVPITVRCVAPRLTRQMRRAAERAGRHSLVDAPVCGEEFRVLPGPIGPTPALVPA